MIGYVHTMLEKDLCNNASRGMADDFQRVDARCKALNVPPRQVGRGCSETLSIDTGDLHRMLDVDNYRYRTEEERANYRSPSHREGSDEEE